MVESAKQAASSKRLRRGRTAVVFWSRAAAVAGILAIAEISVADLAAKPLCKDPEKPHFVLSTAAGRIVVELAEDAAPRTIRELLRLVTGPYFDPASATIGGDGSAQGYYDGLAFDYTHPHVEIVTALRDGDETRFTQEIDAAALGLDRRILEDPGTAMNMLQDEILENHRAGRPSTPRLRRWLEQWYASREADFLVGVSLREVYEALGHVYTQGLASRPVHRGAVVLKPLSPRFASARLGLVLTDIPERTGKWMVIGRVVEGFATAEAISVGPRRLTSSGRPGFTPVEPVVIDTLRFVCRRAP